MIAEIKELRNKTGMSQREFASQYGIPLSTLRKWEQGEAKPAPYIVNLIADKLRSESKENAVKDSENAAKERIRELIQLQRDLRSKFSERDYNVFVFGSYPTIRYNDESDVDIAVYSKDLELYKKMSFTIETFFKIKEFLWTYFTLILLFQRQFIWLRCTHRSSLRIIFLQN